MPPVKLIFIFSHLYFRHWERGEGGFILLGRIIHFYSQTWTWLSSGKVLGK